MTEIATSGERPLVRLVDDDADLRAAQLQSLEVAGFRVEPYAEPAAALEGLGPDWPGVVLSDVRMPGMDGFEFHRRVQTLDPDLPVILLTGHGDVPMAVAALKAGAWDFLTKPVGRDALIAALRRASEARALRLDNRRLRREALPVTTDPALAGDSPVIRQLRETVARLAETGADVLILGPAGSGRGRAFVTLNCAALVAEKFEAELLGQPGPGRQPRIPGRLEMAARGTLYLEDIDQLAPALQPRLLALIEAGEIWPGGTAAPRPADFRLIASAREEPARMAGEGRFLPDLAWHLPGVTMEVPPLAARRADIPGLFRLLLVEACHRLQVSEPELTAPVRARLSGYGWPGNLQELRQYADAVALGLPIPMETATPMQPAPLTEMMAGYEAELIREALRLSGGNASRAMDRLGLPRKTFYDKLARHGIRPGDFRGGPA